LNAAHDLNGRNVPHQRKSDEGRRAAGEEGSLRSAPGQWRTLIADAGRDVGWQHQRQALCSAGRGEQRSESQTFDAGLTRQGRVSRCVQVGILMKQRPGLCKDQRDNQQHPEERPGA
jgi:hypothetical protein